MAKNALGGCNAYMKIGRVMWITIIELIANNVDDLRPLLHTCKYLSNLVDRLLQQPIVVIYDSWYSQHYLATHPVDYPGPHVIKWTMARKELIFFQKKT